MTRMRRGDMDENGMIFWQTLRGKPYMVTPEVYAQYRSKSKHYTREYAAKTRHVKGEARNAATARWRKNNPEKRRESASRSYNKSAEKWKLYSREYNTINRKSISQKSNAYVKKKRAEDPLFALKMTFRTRLGNAFRVGGFKKEKSSVDLLGCTWGEFKLHIESQFTEGMTWENRGRNGWHIDHVKPLANAKTLAAVQELCHYTNLQPLWEADNIRKGVR